MRGGMGLWAWQGPLGLVQMRQSGWEVGESQGEVGGEPGCNKLPRPHTTSSCAACAADCLRRCCVSEFYKTMQSPQVHYAGHPSETRLGCITDKRKSVKLG